MVRTLTLEDRRKTELMWRRSASPVKTAAELEISQCTVYTELKRSREMDGAGDVVLGESFRGISTSSTTGILCTARSHELLVNRRPADAQSAYALSVKSAAASRCVEQRMPFTNF